MFNSRVFIKPLLRLQGPFTVQVEVSKTKAQASARVLPGLVLRVTVPSWAKEPEGIVTNLYNRACKQLHKHAYVWQRYGAEQGLLAIETSAQLKPLVEEINAQTLQGNLAGVKLGHAKLSRMAQINTRTRMMTVSRFVVHQVPELAFRYLIIHELSHLTHPNHSRFFWQLVASHMPDFRIHEAVLDAHHYWLTVGMTPETIFDLLQPEAQKKLFK
jgi:predicted metal-dependent hydrolase